MTKPNLENYVTVAERLAAFYAKHEHGSIQAELLHDDGKRVVMVARAYRSPDDVLPGIGHAEEIRGEGMVNKTSALENCETSCWGRAIAALGFEVNKDKEVATREEVELAIAQQENSRQRGKPVNLVTKDWVEDATDRIKRRGLTRKTMTMKLATFNVTKLEELTEPQAALLDQWLSEQSIAKVPANG